MNSGRLVTSGSTSNWQKAKITKDDGKIMQITGFDFNNPEQKMGEFNPIYLCFASYKLSGGVSTNGTVEYW